MIYYLWTYFFTAASQDSDLIFDQAASRGAARSFVCGLLFFLIGPALGILFEILLVVFQIIRD